MSSLRRSPFASGAGGSAGDPCQGPRRGEPTDGHSRRRRTEAAGRCAGLVFAVSGSCEPIPGCRGTLQLRRDRASWGPRSCAGLRAGGFCAPEPLRRWVTPRGTGKIKDACRAEGSPVRLYGHSFLRLEIEPRRRPACHSTL